MLTDQGHVYTWGRCDSGQLGVGHEWMSHSDKQTLLHVCLPQRVAGFVDERVLQVTCGTFHTAAVTESGAVYIWGKEDYGMLGVGRSADVQAPRKIEFFDAHPALRVSCGGWHTVVVTQAGDCYAFGRGEYGRLGLGDSRSRSHPHLVEALQGKHVVQAACGGSHTLFLTADGVAYSVGRSDHGRLGYIDENGAMLPSRIERLTLGSQPVRLVAAGGAHSIALQHPTRSIGSPFVSPVPSPRAKSTPHLACD